MTCSIGFAYYPFLSDQTNSLSWEQVVAVADRALYVAKKSGRNAWVGLYGTTRTRELDASHFLKLVNEELDELVDQGRLSLETSIEQREELVWAWA